MHVNKTDFHMKGFTLGLASKQRRKATWKSPIGCVCFEHHENILETFLTTDSIMFPQYKSCLSIQ